MTFFKLHAALDVEARDALKRVVPSLTVGFPDRYDDRSDEAKLVRSIMALVNSAGRSYEDDDEVYRGEYYNIDIFERAIVALERQVEVCAREADIDWWRSQIPEDVKPPVEGQPGTYANNPHHMAAAIVESRQVQVREASEALAHLRRSVEDFHRAERHVADMKYAESLRG